MPSSTCYIYILLLLNPHFFIIPTTSVIYNNSFFPPLHIFDLLCLLNLYKPAVYLLVIELTLAYIECVRIMSANLRWIFKKIKHNTHNFTPNILELPLLPYQSSPNLLPRSSLTPLLYTFLFLNLYSQKQPSPKFPLLRLVLFLSIHHPFLTLLCLVFPLSNNHHYWPPLPFTLLDLDGFLLFIVLYQLLRIAHATTQVHLNHFQYVSTLYYFLSICTISNWKMKRENTWHRQK